MAQPHPGRGGRKEAAAVLAEELFQMARHPDPGAGADLTGYLHISVAPLRALLVRCHRQGKEPLHALKSEISGLLGVLSASHDQALARGDIKSVSYN